ncbi:odorant receptor 10-like [Prorops nasuta]|uniref:odorant receptor 10-like n=1 Tax=Prorops nasuta TaxID=863751 RepID=UPI0034CDDA32
MILLNTFIEETDLQRKLKTVGPIMHWSMSTTTYTFLQLHSNEIRKCIQDMETDWKSVSNREEREIMLTSAKFGRYIAAICVLFLNGGVLSYIIVMSGSSSVAVKNETIVLKFLPFPFYSKIIDTRFSPAFEVVLLFQSISCIMVNSVTAGACGLTAVFVAHANGQIRIMLTWLEDFVDGYHWQNSTIKQRLARIVDKHLSVLRFITRIEVIINEICLVEVVGSTLIFCFLGYYLIKEWQDHEVKNLVSYIMLSVSFVFNIFLYCYIGDLLSQQCRKVGECAYMTKWYRLPGKASLGLILIISRSSFTIKITAGKLKVLSLQSFGDIVRAALVYLNMLRTMTE